MTDRHLPIKQNGTYWRLSPLWISPLDKKKDVIKRLQESFNATIDKLDFPMNKILRITINIRNPR